MIGRKSAKARRTPVGDGCRDRLWVVAERGLQEGYVINNEPASVADRGITGRSHIAIQCLL